MALTGLPEADTFALLDRALDAGILVVSGGRYRFRHELVRQALVEQLTPHQLLASHRDTARRLADAGAAPGLIARHWLAGGRPGEASGWLLDASPAGRRTRRIWRRAHSPGTAAPARAAPRDALSLRAEALDAIGDGGAPVAYAAAACVADRSAAHELEPSRRLAQIKLGDPAGGLRILDGVHPDTVEGRLTLALAFCGAAALGFGDPEIGAAKAAEARRWRCSRVTPPPWSSPRGRTQPPRTRAAICGTAYEPTSVTRKDCPSWPSASSTVSCA